MTPTRRTFLAAAAMSPLAASLSAAAEPTAYWVYFGTYTGSKSGSKGIYRSKFDPANGSLSAAEAAAEVGSPSFVCPSPNHKVLYAVGETPGGGGKGGGVYAYSIDAKTGDLSKIGESDSGGAGPCHVSTDPAGKLLLVANYTAGSWKLFQLTPDGRFGTQSIYTKLEGSGKEMPRQAKPLGHCGSFDPTGATFFVVDLGSDRVWWYDVPADGAEAVNRRTPIALPPGSGPRHVHVAPGNDWAFVNGEIDSTVNVVRLDAKAGKGEVVQSLSTLPGGKPVKGNSTAEVRIHPAGKFVYVSNRGHNSVAAFAWDGAKLTPVGHATEGIKVPRNFNLDPSGKWMLVANMDGDDVGVFAVGDDGLPKPTGKTVKVDRPVCVKFVPAG